MEAKVFVESLGLNGLCLVKIKDTPLLVDLLGA
jgi:hypothetical protein